MTPRSPDAQPDAQSDALLAAGDQSTSLTLQTQAFSVYCFCQVSFWFSLYPLYPSLSLKEQTNNIHVVLQWLPQSRMPSAVSSLGMLGCLIVPLYCCQCVQSCSVKQCSICITPHSSVVRHLLYTSVSHVQNSVQQVPPSAATLCTHITADAYLMWQQHPEAMHRIKTCFSAVRRLPLSLGSHASTYRFPHTAASVHSHAFCTLPCLLQPALIPGAVASSWLTHPPAAFPVFSTCKVLVVGLCEAQFLLPVYV